ncbi:MAG: helix-turn-helix transcriptional regulator, partial [Planctomycetes bacterium]|nr:helix-turn-helix transcriptional regulator [Planctomycetota bacterium]
MSSNREDFTQKGLIQVCQRLQKARKACGFTLDELARRTLLSKSLLSKIENFRSIPSLPVLATLAQALSVDMAELVQGIGAESEESCCLVKAGDRTLVDRDDA